LGQTVQDPIVPTDFTQISTNRVCGKTVGQEKHFGNTLFSRAHRKRIPLSIDTRGWMGQNIYQSILLRPLKQPLVHKEIQPPLLLHPIQVAGPIGEAEEGAMRAVMDETMEAEMEEDLESLVSNHTLDMQLWIN